jgi:hypothetical protein
MAQERHVDGSPNARMHTASHAKMNDRFRTILLPRQLTGVGRLATVARRGSPMSTLDPEPSFTALISLPEIGRPFVELRVAMRSMGRLDEIASDATSSRIGRASQLFVDCLTRLHGVEFCAHRPERVAADQEVLRRLRHVHQSEDRRRSPVRIA